MNQFFNLDYIEANDSINYLKNSSPNYNILDDWHFFPGNVNGNLSLLLSQYDEVNKSRKFNKYIRFEIKAETNFALLEKHIKVQDIAAKNLDITFWARAPFGRVVISSVGYLVPQGRLDESAIMFTPTRGSPYELDDKWKMIRLSFSVPPIDSNKVSKDSYALIRPVFIGSKVSNTTVDIADFRLNAYDSSRGYPASYKEPTNSLLNMVGKYITESDNYNSKDEILEEFKAIKAIETLSASNSEVLWRLARVHMRLAEIGKTREEREISVIAAATYAWRAIQISSNVNTLKWWGITAAELGKIEGNQQYIVGSKILADNLTRAIEIDPANASLYYFLGKWNVEWATLDTFWPSKLQGSHESARKLFLKAVNFEPKNVMYRLWLASTLLQLNYKDEAYIHYQTAVNVGIKTDAEVALANELLLKLNQK